MTMMRWWWREHCTFLLVLFCCCIVLAAGGALAGWHRVKTYNWHICLQIYGVRVCACLCGIMLNAALDSLMLPGLKFNWEIICVQRSIWMSSLEFRHMVAPIAYQTSLISDTNNVSAAEEVCLQKISPPICPICHYGDVRGSKMPLIACYWQIKPLTGNRFVKHSKITL